MTLRNQATHLQEPTQEAAATAPTFAPFPLQSLTLTFHTNDDDKDADTVVSVSIDNHATLMGTANLGGQDRWGDGETRVYMVPVANGVDYYEAEKGHMNVTIHPNGDDEWHFDVRLDMKFAGNGSRSVVWNGLNVAEDRPSFELTWS